MSKEIKSCGLCCMTIIPIVHTLLINYYASLKGMLIMNKEIKSCGLYLHHSKPWKNDRFPTRIIKSHNPRTKNLKYFLGLHLTGTTSSKEGEYVQRPLSRDILVKGSYP